MLQDFLRYEYEFYYFVKQNFYAKLLHLIRTKSQNLDSDKVRVELPIKSNRTAEEKKMRDALLKSMGASMNGDSINLYKM